MRKFIVSVVVALVVLCGASFYVYKAGNVSETYENNETKKVNNNNMLSMMLETEFNSGEYQETTASAWPIEGYVFNTTLSKCKNGSVLSWDNDEKQVKFDGNTKDECYVYFDVYKEPTIITDICKSNDNLSNCIKNLYVSQGKNNLYLHDSTLENGAGDNSYRYAGSSDTTNNFVCFGYDSKDGSCPTDYLYRIIGVFDNQVKLIKYDYAKSTLLGTNGDYVNSYEASGIVGTNLGVNSKGAIGTYYWYYNVNFNEWENGNLNTINLNNNFLNNAGTAWKNKIADHTWIVAGNTWGSIGNSSPSSSYKNEIKNPIANTTYDAKIGLMYVSDYGFAAYSSAWNTKLSTYRDVLNDNWMFMGLYEWTITPQKSDTKEAFVVASTGDVYYFKTNENFAARPCFYLNSDVTYISGKGTKTEPILL